MSIAEPIVTIDPYLILVEDIAHDDLTIPQMQDPERIPTLEVQLKPYEDTRTPDIETARTKVYITGWEMKRDHPIPRRS